MADRDTIIANVYQYINNRIEELREYGILRCRHQLRIYDVHVTTHQKVYLVMYCDQCMQRMASVETVPGIIHATTTIVNK